MLAWKDRNRSSRAAFEIAHRKEIADLGVRDLCEEFVGWLGMENAEDVTRSGRPRASSRSPRPSRTG